MKFTATFIATIATAGLSVFAQNTSPDGDVSLKLEIERAITKGAKFLESQQDKENGYWSEETLPAFTSLALAAIMGDPNADVANKPEFVQKGYTYLVGQQKNDGGIYGKGLATYNTSLAIMALIQSGEKEHLPVIAKARRLLVNQQQDHDKRGETDNMFDGGIGYGGSYAHSDLSNTHLAAQALYYSKKVLADTEHAVEFDLDWDAAIDFISLCQNSEKSVDRLGDQYALREEDKGGFVYFPTSTKSDEIELETNGEKRVALRSYGSMSYAGLLAFLYAEMDMEDPRLQAALKWLQGNYTLEENPGMDQQGLFYYYHTMAKALALGKIKTLKTPEGKTIQWRQELALKILENQKPDGSWINEGSNRWMEDNPVLVSSYSMIALQHIYHSL
ncbi:MAG: prenyltransferase/squalene oxidase repeat-containing protein [Verrucomicrobiota bacterium]